MVISFSVYVASSRAYSNDFGGDKDAEPDDHLQPASTASALRDGSWTHGNSA